MRLTSSRCIVGIPYSRFSCWFTLDRYLVRGIIAFWHYECKRKLGRNQYLKFQQTGNLHIKTIMPATTLLLCASLQGNALLEYPTTLEPIYLCAGKSTVSYAQSYQVTKTFLQINYFYFWCQPWCQATSAHTMACGLRTPQPSAYLSLSHHQQWHVLMVWSNSLHSTSSWLHNRGGNNVTGLEGTPRDVWGVYWWRWGGWRQE